MTDTTKSFLDRQLDRLAETLFNSIDRLEQHTDQRAAELAQPRIAAAEEVLLERVANAEEERDHWKGRCSSEILRRAREHDDLHKRVTSAEPALARARLLHPTPAELVASNAESDTLCTTCISPAPCPTRRALDGED